MRDAENSMFLERHVDPKDALKAAAAKAATAAIDDYNSRIGA